MKRSLKFSLKFGNTGKLQKLDGLFQEYRKAVNDFLEIMIKSHSYVIPEQVVKDYESGLSYRYKQAAKRQAIKIWKSWRRNKRKGRLPEFKNTMILDARFIQVESKPGSSFDYWVKIAILEKGKPVEIPFKSYGYANSYFRDWNLLKGGRLQKLNDSWFLILTFEKEAPELRRGDTVIGMDIGYGKLITTSGREFLGRGMKRLSEKSARRKQKSRNWKQTGIEVKNYVNQVAKEFVSNLSAAVLVMEELKNLKKNKHGKWSREVNRRFNFWLYGLLVKRLKEHCEATGVQLVAVAPQYTSQRCPVCGHIDSLNRKGELFRCLRCNYTEDADYVGALNVLHRFTGESISPPGKGNNCNVCL